MMRAPVHYLRPAFSPGRTPALAIATLAALVTAACNEGGMGTGTERAAYLTLIGDDTLAVEWVEFGDGYVEADALVRGSQTTFRTYRLEMSEAGEVTAYETTTHAGGTAEGEVLRSERLVTDDEGRALIVTQGGDERRVEFDAEPGSVPFIDMLHWPFEAALRWQVRQGGFQGGVRTFSGRGMTFPVTVTDEGTYTIEHPSRGPSTAEIDDEGRILALDGTGSTRAYDLTREDWDELDRAALGATFADRPLGELSGRGEIDDEVAGVHFTGHYGTPVRRGRDIFGGLLAYGVWWRTGANQATHFSLDGDIEIDGEVVPAGDYTLSSIPEEAGGTLIINRQTGQGGQSYDETQDQARVELRRDRLDEPVEVLEIRVVDDPSGEADGRIELRWDDTVYWVPFTVR
jgi:hypothetical protein